MTTTTTSTVSNSVRVRQVEAYQKGAKMRRVYDRIAKGTDDNPTGLFRSTSIVKQFLNGFDPAVDAISEINDVTPEGLTDASASYTTTSRGKAHRFSEKLSLTNFTDYEQKAFEKLGDNMMESVDLLAQAQALQGGLVSRGAARASLDAGTTGHLLKDSTATFAQSRLQDLHTPMMDDEFGGSWLMIGHPAVYHDLRTTGNIVSVANYQRPDIILNQELGRFGPFRIISTAWAKVFGAAGADNGTAVATTLNGAVLKGATSIVTAGDVSASIAAGRVWTIGTEETANTHYPDNELVIVTAASTTTLTIVGQGDNGGLRYNHDTGVAVRNADCVYPVVYGYPGSLDKAYSSDVGEYGELSSIEKDGELEQFRKVFWKWYGGYGLLVQSTLLRGEYASSLDA